jgi:acyl carrier protein
MFFMNKEEILQLVIRATRRVVEENETYDPDKVDFNTPLFSKKGIVDSLGLVQLIADIEEEFYQATRQQLILADEKAMSMKFSPFRSISSLVDYIESQFTDETD